MGIAILAGEFNSSEAEDMPPEFFGIFIIIFASLMILMGFVLSILILLNGLKLSKHKRYTFCFIVSCVECIFMPFGTVLGIFTIITLTDESTKNLFKQPSSKKETFIDQNDMF